MKAGGFMAMTISNTASVTCQMQLLAKDGIYLPTAPRTISSIPFSPGQKYVLDFSTLFETLFHKILKAPVRTWRFFARELAQ